MTGRSIVPRLLLGLTLGFVVLGMVSLTPPRSPSVTAVDFCLAVTFSLSWLALSRRPHSRRTTGTFAIASLLLTGMGSLFALDRLPDPIPHQATAIVLAAIGCAAWSFSQVRRPGESITKLYREAFRRSKDAVVISTAAGKIVDINQTGLDLFGLESLEAARSFDLTQDLYANPADREGLKKRLLRDRSVQDYPTTIRRNDELIDIEGSTSILDDLDGRTLFLAILRDVSKRKQEERELTRYREDLEGLVHERTLRLEEAVGQLRNEIAERQRAEEERRQIEDRVQRAQKLESLDLLAGGVAHDFNNLLVGILGNAGLASLELPRESQVEPFLERIAIAARRAGELASQLLAYSGRGQFTLRRCDLASLVREMTQLLEASVSKKATIELTLDEDLPAINADPTQLRQVIMNLITNASDALEAQDGVIGVRVGLVSARQIDQTETLFPENITAENYVFLEVADSGCGMDTETRKRIFDPFFTTKLRGRGLGMAAVLGIVRGHHGTIRLSSEPALGSRFVIHLPAQSASIEIPAESTPEPERSTPWKGRGTVLVVDDEPVVRAVAANYLARLGFETIEAEDGQEAINYFQRHADEIELVVLDMNMPHLDGVETTHTLRQIRPNLPIILSSGEGRPREADQPEGIVWSDWLKKPYTLGQLKAVVRRVLEPHRIEQG